MRRGVRGDKGCSDHAGYFRGGDGVRVICLCECFSLGQQRVIEFHGGTLESSEDFNRKTGRRGGRDGGRAALINPLHLDSIRRPEG